jgi:two-component system nitrate/nitrite response regulator NarL
LLQQNLFMMHYFCSDGMEIPLGLTTAFPQIQMFKRQPTASANAEAIMVWLHLRPGQTVAQQMQALKQLVPGAYFVGMSDLPNDLEALAVFSVMAKGYCNTHAGAEVLLNVASVVQQGGVWIGESLMQKLLGMPPVVPQLELAAESWSGVLTGRETEVAKAIAVGATNKQIATQMGITERTVKAHVGAVLDKLKLKNRLQLALLVKDR